MRHNPDHETCFVWCLTMADRTAPPVDLFAEPAWAGQHIDPRLFRLTKEKAIEGLEDWRLTIVDLVISQPWALIDIARIDMPQKVRTFGGPLYSILSARPPLDYVIPAKLPTRAVARCIFPTGTGLYLEPVIISATVQFTRN